MTLDDILPRLAGVRRTSRGYLARCPAHPDRHPSLSVSEGERGILVKCWAGCSLRHIVAALGLTIRDLFRDDGSGSRGLWNARRLADCRPGPLDWRRTGGKFENHALSLWLRAERVLKEARGLDLTGWGDEDIDAALSAVARAYQDLERARVLEAVAFGLRQRGLRQEKERDASRRSAA
jgi:hypothetical protein